MRATFFLLRGFGFINISQATNESREITVLSVDDEQHPIFDFENAGRASVTADSSINARETLKTST